MKKFLNGFSIIKVFILVILGLTVVLALIIFPPFYQRAKKDHIDTANSKANLCYRFLQKSLAEDKLSEYLSKEQIIMGELKNGNMTLWDDKSVSVIYSTNEQTSSFYWGAQIKDGAIMLVCTSNNILSESDIRTYTMNEQLELSFFWNECSIGYYSP